MCSLDDTCISQLHEYIVFKKLSGKIYIREKGYHHIENEMLQMFYYRVLQLCSRAFPVKFILEGWNANL